MERGLEFAIRGASGNGWFTAVSPGSVSLGSTGVVTVTATSQGDPSEKDVAVLTTRVGVRFVYLPLVLRNY